MINVNKMMFEGLQAINECHVPDTDKIGEVRDVLREALHIADSTISAVKRALLDEAYQMHGMVDPPQQEVAPDQPRMKCPPNVEGAE